MAHRLTVSDRAVREIGEAYEWYEEQLHGLGAKFIDALDVQLQLITQTPLLFPEIRRGIRRTLLSHFPYGVFYASKGDVVSVLAVVHTARSPRRWPRYP
jgi:plasmid stabilization system protein ParE